MNDPLFGAIGIAICLALSAFFSGAETALTSIGRTRTRRMIDEEGVLAMRLWLNRPAHVLTTILICNNIVNVTASALATETANVMLPPSESAFLNPVAIAIGVTTMLLLTFGEITPKTLARVHARRIAGPLMRVLGPITRLLTIPNAAFVGLASALARLGGHDLHDTGPSVQEDDITYLATLGLAEGSIEERHADLIQRVFSLDDTLVEVVMVPWVDVVALPIDADRATILQTLTRTRHSRLPVYQERQNDVVGLLYAKDMLRIEEILPDDQPLELRNLIRPTMFAAPDEQIDELLQRMKADGKHLAIVQNDGDTLGIITLEDIIEELIGEIYDEFDHEGPNRPMMDAAEWAGMDADADVTLSRLPRAARIRAATARAGSRLIPNRIKGATNKRRQ